MSFLQDKIFKLKGKIMHYAWGGYDFIPAWLGIENNERKPFAEYWMGAHPLASSDIVTRNGELSLHQMINNYPEEFLGKKVCERFGELPYLYKVQDVKDILSIQVHPSKEEAGKGFEREEALGIKANAANRNYKDKNHKPEVLVALSEFWLLHGFLETDALKKMLQSIPEFSELDKIFNGSDYETLYSRVMQMPQEDVDALLIPLVKRELQRKQNNEFTKAQPGWWVAKLFEHEENIEHIDRGVFSIYFFNIVEANPGEAVFQGAGIPHAYLEGQTMELMANSDNVLRGGLTNKHIDIPELMRHVTFAGVAPNVITGEEMASGEKNYPCPVPDFGISRIELKAGETYQSEAASLEIIAVMNGEMEITGSASLVLKKGEAAAILYGEKYTISTPHALMAYKAFVPKF